MEASQMSDFWYYNKSWIIMIIVMVVIAACVCWGAALVSEKSCDACTQNIGFAHRWSFLGGCQIEVTEGQWIPLDNYYFKQE